MTRPPRLSGAAILAVEDLAIELVEVPEWGATVGVRTMTGTERDAFELAVLNQVGDATTRYRNLRARLVTLCAVDEMGERLFTDDQVEALGAKSARALDRLFAAVQRVNALTSGDIEELTKN